MAERLLHIPLAVFDTLKTGTVSPPLPYGKSYHLVRFIEDRKADLQTHQGRIKVQLLKQKRELAVEKEVELLAYESDWQLTSEGLALLKRKGETMGERGDLDLDVVEQKTPLFVFKGGAVTVEEFAEILRNRRIKNKRALVDSGFIASIGRRLLLKNAMLYAAAEKAGLPDDPEVVAWFGKFKRNQLLQLVRRREVIEKITVETEALHEYYEKNKKKYHTYQIICFDEVMVPSMKVALQIREEIDKSTNLLELSYEKNLQVRRRTADGLICLPLHNQNKKAYPELSEALISNPMGELGGPVYTRSGYAIFKKVRDVAARQQSFEEVRKRVRATLAQGIEKQHFSDWIERLRQKYHQRVQTFPEHLTAALPEALLAGTAEEF
jgi:parvulin-like peptidyl-prolyl isomerase